MSLYFLPYYLLKDSIKDFNTFDNQTLFRLSLFYNACDFYKLLNPFKKDNLNIKQKLNNPKEFFLECLSKAKESKKDEDKLFCYALIITHFANKTFRQYYQCYKHKKISYIEKMIDSYMFYKNENKAITSINVADYFFDSFEFKVNELEFINEPFKRVFGIFVSKNYYLNCYDNARNYFDHLYRSKTGLKKIPYFLYDIFLNHKKGKRKAKTFLYKKKIDTKVLNLNHNEYIVDNELIDLDFEAFYSLNLKKAKNIINSINSYFITGKINIDF